MEIIDLSHVLSESTPVYPGDPPVCLEPVEKPAESLFQTTHVSMPSHAGTHIDAPSHIIRNTDTITNIPLTQCTGHAIVVSLPDCDEHATITREKLSAVMPDKLPVEKLIVKTGWSSRWPGETYFSAHPVFSRDAAEYLVQSGLHFLGIEQPSVDTGTTSDAHEVLLENGVVLAENLANLDKLDDGEIFIAALPLKLDSCDGSPARVIAIKGL